MNIWCKSIAFLIAGGVFSNSVYASCYEDHDKFSGSTFHWCGAWGTGGVMLGGLNGLDPIPYHNSTKDGVETWYIKLISAQSKWSNIDAGDKVVFLIDGELFDLPINNRSNRDVDGSNKYQGVQAVEFVNITSSRDFFQKLARGNSVEFALYTKEGRQERTLHKAALEHYSDLLKKIESLNAQ